MSIYFFDRGLEFRQFRYVFAFCLLVFLASNQPQKVGAANPLDVSFGNGGKIIYEFGISTSTTDIAVQPDGKIVVVGFVYNTGPDAFTVVRYNADGTLDTSFSGDGTIIDRFSSDGLDYSQAKSVVIQPDGKIVIAGRGKLGNKTAFGVARFNADGSYDATFDGDGRANIAASPDDNEAMDIALQPDGKIVLVGFIKPNPSNFFPAIVRLNGNGSLDAAFSGDGIISYQNEIFGWARQVFVQPNGKISFTMEGHLGQSSLLFRYNSDGSPDMTFDGDGRLENFSIGSTIFLADGKFLVGWTYTSFLENITDFSVDRFSADGTLDTSFGNNGSSRIDFGGNDNLGVIALQPDGKIIAAGTKYDDSPTSNTGDLAVARLNADGSIDSTFGAGGKIVTPVGEANDIATAAAVQSNGKIIVAGGTTRPNNINDRKGMLVSYMGDLNAADFDGDTRTDISIFRPSGGEWWHLKSSNGGNSAVRFGNSNDKIVPGDYTGDGKTDVAIFRPESGEWFVLRSENNSFYSFPFGLNGDVPIAGDFDGDGKTDSAVYRPSTQVWYILQSAGAGTRIEQFGASGDIPVASDFDGDGKTDVAVYRQSRGQWWIRRSSDGGINAFQFGTASDKPVQSDYTGDGKTDAAFWRPSTGEWFILRSENGSFYGTQFGANGDVPVTGDYDGDGKSDIGVFRPSNSAWYINRSTAGVLIVGFGAQGDIPVPSATNY